MKTIDLWDLSNDGISIVCDISMISNYYRKEFKWLLAHAKEKVPDTSALYVGSYVILLSSSDRAFYNGTRCGTRDETTNFILNEAIRLISEAREVAALFKLAHHTCEEPSHRKVSAFHLLGLKQEIGGQLLDKDVVKVMEFQRANTKTLTKMKAACVRALLREIPQPFEFNDDMDLSDNKRTYKSIFD